jgi:shikimate dehydrogenase
MSGTVSATPYAEVIGDPIAQSKSPAIHNFWLEKLEIEGEYRACHVRAEDLSDYLATRRADPAWRGCNVTMPHKVEIVPLIDRLDPLAERVGAVNTVVPVRGNGLSGFNTDVAGVADPLRQIPIGDYPNHVATYVYIIGAGGAARAAVVGAEQVGPFDIDIFNRSVEKAHPLAAMASAAFGEAHPLDHLTPIRNPDDTVADQRYSHVIINATSMGMLGNPAVPIDLTRFYPDTIVFDMVYTPLETPLLAEARRLGLRTIDGLAMLIGQAAAAFEKFFGQLPPREHDPELRALLTK